MVSTQSLIVLDDECVTQFQALRMKRAHRYIIMKVNDEKNRVIIEHIGERSATFAEFKELMPKDQCR